LACLPCTRPAATQMAAVLKLQLDDEVLRVPLCDGCACKLHAAQVYAFNWLMERGCCPMCPAAAETAVDQMPAHAPLEAAATQTGGADAAQAAPAAPAVANTAYLKFQRNDEMLHLPLCLRCSCRLCGMQTCDFDSMVACSCCPMCSAASLETANTAADERLARMLSEAEVEQLEGGGDAPATDVHPSMQHGPVAAEIRRRDPPATASPLNQSATAIAEVRRARAAAWHGQHQSTAEAGGAAASATPPRHTRASATAGTGVDFPLRRQSGLWHTGPFLLQHQRLHLTNGYVVGPVNLEACEVLFQDVHITGPVCLQNSRVRMQGCRVTGPISLHGSAMQFNSSMHLGPLHCDSRSSYSCV